MSNSLKNEQALVETAEADQDLVSLSASSRRVSNGNNGGETVAKARHVPSRVGDEDNDLQIEKPYNEGLRREEPLDRKSRSFDAKDSGIAVHHAQQRRRRLLGQGSFSMSNAGEDEDPPSKNVMEEKSVTGEENAETGAESEQPKEPEEQQPKPDEKKPTGEKKDRSDEEDDDDDDDDQDTHQMPTEGLYDPNEFINLPVGSDIKELFQFITAYTPQVIEIDTALKPFILDYIPSVGDIDAFIKIPRPDDVEDNLGLLVLDEPCARQSDPTVLDLHLRAASKDSLPKGTVVKKLARADRNPKEIENWIRSIGDLHKSKPATQVHYSKPMPDIDTLMQEWPPEVEETLKQIDLPSADLEQMPLEQYVDTACALLDVPIYKSRIQSLHVLFTLYSEFKNSQHFRALAEENKVENATSAQKASGNTDRLEL